MNYASAGAELPAWSNRDRGLLAVLAANMLIDAIEVSSAIMTIPSVGRGLDLPLRSSQWLLTGFAAGFGGLLLLGGRLVQRLGRRRVYLAGLLLFAAASLASALADGTGVLLAMRFLKGFSVALTAPTGIAIISSAYPAGPMRDRAVSVYTFAGGGGFATGLLMSGVLLQLCGWRWTLAAPAIVVLALWRPAMRFLPDEPPAQRPVRSGDAVGRSILCGLLLAAALLALVRGLVSGQYRLPVLVLAALLLLAFLLAQHALPAPLMEFHLLRKARLVRSIAGAAALNGSYLGLLLVLSVQLQSTLGWTPLAAGLALLPASAPLVFSSLLSTTLAQRFGTAALIVLGNVLAAAACLWYLRVGLATRYCPDTLVTVLLLGLAFAAAFGALNIQGMSAVRPAQRPMAAGLYQSAVQAAAAAVPALVVSLLGAGAADPSRFRPALTLLAAISLFGLAVALLELVDARRRASTELPPAGPGQSSNQDNHLRRTR
ncbi:MAG: MFS transporter [Actinomycetota bacterium]|nr:MFS transporter [Actinomycetota bacterium]MDQ2958037.1 MFS transporter [Actinomycetota bacterium]